MEFVLLFIILFYFILNRLFIFRNKWVGLAQKMLVWNLLRVIRNRRSGTSSSLIVARDAGPSSFGLWSISIKNIFFLVILLIFFVDYYFRCLKHSFKVNLFIFIFQHFLLCLHRSQKFFFFQRKLVAFNQRPSFARDVFN